jgi:hypothetical protein
MRQVGADVDQVCGQAVILNMLSFSAMGGLKQVLLSVWLGWAATAAAQEGGDVQAQILYAYQTEDSNGLANLRQTLSAQLEANAADPALHYHLAHALYRAGQLAVQRHLKGADADFAACIDQLKPLLNGDVKSAEALALQSACYFELAGQRSLEALLLRSKAADRIQDARVLEPHNPRVLLIAAAQRLARAKPGSTERQNAVGELALAAHEFEHASATRPDAPGWGHADAYVLLARELQSRGDRVGARNWAEKALLAAPDSKVAQRQLAQVSGS